MTDHVKSSKIFLNYENSQSEINNQVQTQQYQLEGRNNNHAYLNQMRQERKNKHYCYSYLLTDIVVVVLSYLSLIMNFRSLRRS